MCAILDNFALLRGSLNLGAAVERSLQSSVGSAYVFPSAITTYPPVVVEALGKLFMQYNRAFAPLVEANREWPTDYAHCMIDGSPVNWGVQIDMVGLPEDFLAHAAQMTEPEIREILRLRIFEVENSLAMYQLLERLHSREGSESFFKSRFRRTLAALRRRANKPIALLAVTDEKYAAMRESEFGKQEGETLTDAEVLELSGFDRFFGPSEFRDYITQNKGKCGYLLYVRSSDPVAKLKDPRVVVAHPLLGDSEMRRVIKANAITFNVDDPSWHASDPRRINDTKGYMQPMGMAYQIGAYSDILSVDFAAHLLARGLYDDYTGSSRLSQGFAAYLREQGVNPQDVASGAIHLRAKPVKGTFGCYGHISGALPQGEFRSELRRNMRQRGGYVIQPEMHTPSVVNLADGIAYTFIDRNFMSIVNGRPVFLGGVRMFMPIDSIEAQHRRIHGNSRAVMGEVVSSV